MNLEGKRVTVVGLGLSGSALVKFLASRGALVGVSESAPRLGFEHWLKVNASLLERTEFGGHTEAFLVSSDLVVLSPGVRPDLAPVAAAAQRGVAVVGELEVALDGCAARVAAVTGTNGKTTTTALLGHLLATAGVPCTVAGNIGIPVSGVVDEVGAGHALVLEVSSFQLDSAPSFHPSVAVLLNVTPDHQDRYPSLEAYAASKARIFANQGPADFAILNRGDGRCTQLAPALKARVRWFDADSAGIEGAGLDADWLTLCEGGRRSRILPAADLAIPGRHNLENALAACAAAGALGVAPGALAEGLRTFRGVEHRLEPVGEIGDVRFVNDSKATNTDALEKALLAFREPVVLIAGGRDKNLDFTKLKDLIAARVKAVVLIGEAAGKIESAWRGAAPMRNAATIEEAVETGYELARPKGLVLLSPGCASYDMFRNFEDRGRRFREAVGRLASRGGFRARA
ncbi:MAG: UDP-N-acetylmuramoyl-L-alanine--D-glutamate ligase [Candidatus Coatesbacteria bacterium]